MHQRFALWPTVMLHQHALIAQASALESRMICENLVSTSGVRMHVAQVTSDSHGNVRPD
jgi:hypothetical protein